LSPRGSASASGPTAGTTNASPNLVECFFSIITREAIRRGSFTSVRELTGPAGAFIDSWNDHPRPFA
jgi:hypothetical protein